MPSLSKLDAIYRSIMLAKFFTKGWGKPDNLKRLFAFRKVIANRETCQHLVESDYPVIIDNVEKHPNYQILDGHLLSPFVNHLPEVVPEESKIARFQVLLPNVWSFEPMRPICLHLAGTGDHFYWRRRILMARPLLKEAGIASILLENPFYGPRKPKSQRRSSLHNVSDIFVMGGCLILETLALFHWCEREGFGPLGISGISMGGHMASLAGCSWHKPIPIIPCLSWTTASCVFTEGVMSAGIPWPLLQNQYSSDHVYQDEIWKMLHSPEESDAFKAGILFSRNYPSSLERMELLKQEENSNDRNPHLNENSILYSKSKSHQLLSPSELSKLEALNFMRGIMDECTHLGNFTPPVDPSLSIVVTAEHDAYVPRDGIKSIGDLWKGCEVRYIDAGHITAFLFNHGVFRKAIIDAFEKTVQKYHRSSILLEDSKIEQDANS
ncbi:protein ABHD18-like [Stegodyphus dumicola]|uniref:protein ABHD18-like n=1 Tax=Stegodyphus dumicola TaxID=202533 RepID=UPI0015ABD012|nr:protein ABHD18-like [Stegodyphus dumicola]